LHHKLRKEGKLDKNVHMNKFGIGDTFVAKLSDLNKLKKNQKVFNRYVQVQLNELSSKMGEIHKGFGALREMVIEQKDQQATQRQ